MKYSLFASLITLAVGCTDDMVGVQFQAVSGSSSAAPGTTVADDQGTVFTLTSAQVHVRDIELDVPSSSDCDDVAGTDCVDQTIKIAGPFVIDLLTGTATPSLEDVQVPAGTYKRIDFRIEDGSALSNRSMVATATFEQDAQAMALELALRFNEDIRVEDPAGIEVSGDAAALLTTFDVNAWLSGLDIADCVARGELAVTGSTVHVDDDTTSGTGSCSEIENVIKLNIKTSAQLDRND